MSTGFDVVGSETASTSKTNEKPRQWTPEEILEVALPEFSPEDGLHLVGRHFRFDFKEGPAQSIVFGLLGPYTLSLHHPPWPICFAVTAAPILDPDDDAARRAGVRREVVYVALEGIQRLLGQHVFTIDGFRWVLGYKTVSERPGYQQCGYRTATVKHLAGEFALLP